MSARSALLATTMLGSATALVLAGSGMALAQSLGGDGGPIAGPTRGGTGGGYGQNGANGPAGTTGGGGGGPGVAGTLGGTPGNNSGGFGGTGGANGVTAAAVPVLSATGAAGGNAQPSVNGTTQAGGGGGSGGYGLVLTTAGPHSTTAGQVFTGGAGGAGNGAIAGGLGGFGGGGLLLQLGGTFTNAQGASVIGGLGGASPTTGSLIGYINGGNALETSASTGTPVAATVTNAGTITGGMGGTVYVAPGTASTVAGSFGSGGGGGIALLGGGSVTNTATGVITGGAAGTGFAGTPTHSAGGGGLSGGAGIAAFAGGTITNSGQMSGGVGGAGVVAAAGSRPVSSSAQGASFIFAGGTGGYGLRFGGLSGSIVNNATGVIQGGNGGNGGGGVISTGNQPVAGLAGGGGIGLETTQGSILNLGKILGGNAGNSGNATAAGQAGAGGGISNGFAFGGDAVAMFGVASPISLDNRAIITGGGGANGGTSGAGAAGASGEIGGNGVSAFSAPTAPIVITNSGSITGGKGGAGSAGTTNGANGLGGVGIQMLGDGTITTSSVISGGLNGDGATRANAITFLSGVHTLTLQTGATLTGNVVVDTAATSNPGVSASNTVALEGPGSWSVALPQLQNFGHLTQTAGTWTLTGAGAVTVDTIISGGTMVLAAGAVLTSPAVSVLTGGTLSLSTAALANDPLTINGGTLQVTGTTLNSLGNAMSLGANGGRFDIAAAANNFVVSQFFSGAGGLTKVGAGTLTLTADHTYTGGTTISAGTLQLGNGGPGGSIAGNVTNNANLAFNHSNAFTFGGVISGSGAVQQNGSGNTTLTAASTYTGLTSINAGTLTVNGSLVSSVNVNSGGTLMGTGTVGGVNANGGTVAPGNSIGTLNVNGNVSFGPGSTYLVEVGTAQSDKIAATGTATLSGGAVQIVSTSINGCGQASYTILTASGGVNGTFSGLNSNIPFLAPTLTYTSNSVVLGLTGKSAAFSGVAQTQNQRKVTAALDASPCSSALVQALLPLTTPQALAAFDQLSGEAHASTAGVLVDESSYMRSAVLGRLRQASYGGDTSMAALSLGGPQVAFQDEELATLLAYGKSPLPVKAPMVAPAVSRDVVFWAQGFGARGTFDGDGNAASLKRDLAGFLTGFDARIGNGRAGIAAGYTASRNNIDGRGTSNVETGHLAAYGGWSFGALNLRAGGAYAWHAIDTDRNIVFPGFFDRANARYNGGTGQLFGEAGYGFAFGKVAVEPFAGAAWVHLRTDAFNETGGAAALAVAANTFEVGYSTLGIRAASVIPLGDGMVLVPRASAAWQHALSDVTPTTTAAFLSTGTSFVVGGVPIARDSVLAEAGLDLHIGRSATLGVSYTGQLASNVQDHAGKGKFSWRF